MKHVFTVDVEDWYQGIPVGEEVKRGAESRLEEGVDALLRLMAENEAQGTFFILGPVAESYPRLVQRIDREGHEVGCHGWSHDLLYEMKPERMREETKRATGIIEDLIGKPIVSYRAAYFSITRRSEWALEILAELGFQFDSSVFPVKNWRYGIPDFPLTPQRLETPSGPIFEFPISVRRTFGHNLPVSGGAYFRIYPYFLTRSNIHALEAQNRPVLFYLHPWELIADHPRVSFHWKAQLTHYVNLRSTVPKLQRLLGDFRFGTLGEVLGQEVGEATKR